VAACVDEARDPGNVALLPCDECKMTSGCLDETIHFECQPCFHL